MDAEEDRADARYLAVLSPVKKTPVNASGLQPNVKRYVLLLFFLIVRTGLMSNTDAEWPMTSTGSLDLDLKARTSERGRAGKIARGATSSHFVNWPVASRNHNVCVYINNERSRLGILPSMNHEPGSEPAPAPARARSRGCSLAALSVVDHTELGGYIGPFARCKFDKVQ